MLEYEYDAAGNRTRVETAAGSTDYTFDERNRLESVTDSAQGRTTYSYDSESNLTGMVLPSGIVESRKYDRLNRLTEIEQMDGEAVVGGYAYELDAVGNRMAVTEADDRRVVYGYDDLDRLTMESISDPGDANDGRTFSYTYDDVGNRVRRVDSVDGVTTYVYDGNDRLLEEVSDGVKTTYSYDDNGNTLTMTVEGEGTTTYSWDDRNRLVGVTTPDGGEVSYEYDEENIRVASTVNGVESRFVVDANRAYHQVLDEYVDGVLEARYVYGLDLISQERDGAVSVFLTDGLGSSRALTDLDGNVVATYDFDAYGVTIGSSGSIVNDYLFAGEQFDEELEQYYLRQRFYDQSSGRFGRRDTYEGKKITPITLNKYIYGNASPIRYTDPTGLYGIAEANAAASISSILNNAHLERGLRLAESITNSETESSPISDDYEILVSNGGLEINDQISRHLEQYTTPEIVFRFLVYGGAIPIPKRVIGVPVIGNSSRLTNPMSLLALTFRGSVPRLPFRIMGTTNSLRAMGRLNSFLAPALLVYDIASLVNSLSNGDSEQ